VHELIDIVSRGGNLLLNVGPTADGRIPVIMQQRLVDIGEWLRVNGEAIYGTKPWKGGRMNKSDNGSVYFTQKGKDLFVICTQWPVGKIAVKGVAISNTARVSLLGYDDAIEWRTTEEGVIIHAPSLNPAANPCSYAWVFKISGLK
jgi:alpha-L-fucosidase